MTRLECTVASCVHNSEKCCCKQGILVEGVNARESCDTCCGSFEENRGGLFKNLFIRRRKPGFRWTATF